MERARDGKDPEAVIRRAFLASQVATFVQRRRRNELAAMSKWEVRDLASLAFTIDLWVLDSQQ